MTALLNIVRQADEELFDRLKAGTFCYVFSPRQMGKSSLIRRTIMRLKTEGIRCGYIDFCIFESNITSEQFYAGFVHQLIREFDLDSNIDLGSWWQDQSVLSPLQKLSKFVETFFLEEISDCTIIFLDEIDSILNLDFLSDFFGYIRASHERKYSNSKYSRLTFALVGVVNPSELSKGSGSPLLNIGQSIELKGFQFHEALPLAQGLEEKVEDPQAVLREILDWTSGQPFLTQKLCQLVLGLSTLIGRGTERQEIEKLVRERMIENWQAHDEPQHLSTIRDLLLHKSENKILVLPMYQEILQKGEITVDNSPDQMQLLLSGLVVKRSGKLRIYNRIYETIFTQNWVNERLSKFKPYAQALSNWLISNRQDKSSLLHGKQLGDALAWAEGKNLDVQDYHFFSASQRNKFLKNWQRRDGHWLRIHELAKALNLDNETLLSFCGQLDIATKNSAEKISLSTAECILEYVLHTKAYQQKNLFQPKQQILEIRSALNTGKVRIYELSRELNLDNKDILTICEQLNISFKSHSSTITEAAAARIRAAAAEYTAHPKSAPVRPVAPPLETQQNSSIPKKQRILEIRKPTAQSSSFDSPSPENLQREAPLRPISETQQNNSIYVGNLSFKVTEKDIRSVFSEYGKVIRVTLPTNRETGQLRGFAFVEMATEAEANAAIAELDEAEWMGREMKVSKAKPRESRPY